MFGDHLEERKWLKQFERKGLKEEIKVTHQDKSITWINQSSYFKWVSRMVLGERSLLPKCRGLPPMCRWTKCGTWKANMEVVIRGAFEMLSWRNQKDWSRKASNTQKRASHDILSGILTLMLSCKQRWNEEVSQPQQESALDH